ncbi:MAG: T9SS type A sorting domain-containing protein [bacterium]|nr:T9SS type A sorting domain-containing protein [bacterium]
MSFTNNDPDFSGFRMKGRGFEINETMTNVFYAVSNAVTPDTGRTLSLDKTSGNGTLLGKSNFADLRGLSIDPITNIMYGLVPSGSSTDLVRVNATEGDAYTLYTLPGLFMVGLDFDTSGVLYGALQSGGIYTIDLSNGSTTQVTTTVQLTSIAFDPTTNELWATPRVVVGQKDRIFKIDLSTGDTTIIGRTGFNVQTNDLAFDETGALYGVIGGAADIGKLISIDKTTAVGTEVGETGYTNVQSLAYRNSGTSSIGEGNELPVTFSLGQNYPNPFNPTTRIEFTLPVASDVELVVYNLLGQEIVTLLSEQKPAGYHSVIWNANDSKGIKLSSGIYFYKLKASGVEGSEFQDIKKMILLK